MASQDARAKWLEATQQILSRLDIEAEYRALGVRIPAGSHARATGWLPVHAVGRDDRDPSAEINVGDGPARGRYRDFGGDGQSLGLFDFAAAHGSISRDWRECRAHYARQTGVKLPDGGDELPADKLDFYTLTPSIARMYAERKPGVTVEAIFALGARAARYPKGMRPELQQHLIAFPMFGSSLLDGEPTAWHCVRQDGAKVRIYKGKGREPGETKTMTLGSPGLMNCAALRTITEPTTKIVWVVEGLTDLLAVQAALLALGERAVGNVVVSAGGCSYHPRPEWLWAFAGKKVCVCFDVDPPQPGKEIGPGQIGAAVWVAALAPAAAEVRNVQLPPPAPAKEGEPPPKIDLRDWLTGVDRSGEFHGVARSYADLFALAKATDPVDRKDKRLEIAPETALLESLGVVVVGQVEGTESTIEVYSRTTNKKTTIRDIDRFSRNKMIVAFGGEVVEEFIGPDGGEPTPGKYSSGDVREAVSKVASTLPTLSAELPIGLGVWPVGEKLVFVGPQSADVWDGKSLTRSTSPVVDKQRLDFVGGDSAWFDSVVLAGYLQSAERPEFCAETVEEARQLFARWDNWAHATSPLLVTGLCMATWIQACWHFRPQVAVIGPSNSGKTMLVEKALQQLFGKLCLYAQKCTEAGVRQAIGHTSKVLILDEFEADDHRSKVLEMLRGSARGTSSMRGATSQKHKAFSLRHIAWTSSIELALNSQADRNRFIVIELAKVPKNRPAKLVVPPPAEMADLGQRLLAVCARHWRAAVELAETYKAIGFGCDSRYVECYAVPTAILALAYGWDKDDQMAMLRSFLEQQEVVDQEEDEEESLLRDIYESNVILPRGRRITVGQLLQPGVVQDGSGEALDRRELLMSLGVRLLQDPDRVFFSRSAVCKELLRGSRFKASDISQIMLRIAGAARENVWMGGYSGRGVSVPLKEIGNLIGAKHDETLF